MSNTADLLKQLRETFRRRLPQKSRSKRRALLIEALERREVFAAPTISILSPVDNAGSPESDNAPQVNTDLSITFNQNIEKGTGNILIKKSSGDATAFSIDVSSSRVTVSGSQLKIDPPGDLLALTKYYVLIPNTAVKNASNEFFAGIQSKPVNDSDIWDFTTKVATEINPPSVASFSPLDNATNVSSASNLVITFTGNIVKGTGNISIRRNSDNSTVQSIDVNSDAVTLLDNVVTINPPADLAGSTGYYIQIPNTAFMSSAGNSYVGINDTTTWNFVTKATPTLTITSGNRDYNGSVYVATASMSGNGTTTPPISFVYYSDAAGSNVISAPKNAGTYYVKASTTEDSTNNAALSAIAQFVITPKGLSITPPSIASKVYNGSNAAGTLTTGTLTGFVNNETVTATAVASAYSSANVGSYSSTISYTLANGANGGLASNYSLANGSATGQITAKTLSITAPSIASRAYDGTTAAGTLTIGTLTGFVGTETVTATAVASAYSSANVGSYSSTISYTLANGANGGLASNYSLANGSATGQITAKTLSITAPSIASRAYDGTTAAGTLTIGTLTGFVGTETVTATAVASAYSLANVGSYSSTISYTLANGANGGLASNYSLANGSATGQITAKTLTISAISKSKYTGQADPTLTYTQLGLVPGDAITGDLTRDAGETVGVYAIRQGTLTAGSNYTISYNGANLTINALIASIAINGADSFSNANQRSMVTSLVVTFNIPVAVAANTFTIRNIGLYTVSDTVLSSNQILVTPDATNRVYTIRFGTGTSVDSRQGTGTRSNSLADGNYRLDVDLTKVTSEGTALTGSSVFGARAADNFYRMYGDSNGDGRVDGTDLAAIRGILLYGQPYNAAFDWDGDGTVRSGVDTTNFSSRQNRRRRVDY